MAHSIALAMQNAVAQQQHAYVLRNAVTSAAAKAALEDDPERALELVDSSLPLQEVTQTLRQLKELRDELLGGDASQEEAPASHRRPAPRAKSTRAKATRPKRKR